MEIVTNKSKLKKPTKPVSEGEDIAGIVDEMLSVLKGRMIVGIAANQLGFDKQIFAINMAGRSVIVMVNPVVTKEKGHQLRREVCLSVPGQQVLIRRPMQITVQGWNQYFKRVKYRFSGFDARKACHELDHLNGKLITDYAIPKS